MLPTNSRSKRKCPICGTMNEKAIATYWKNQYYCPECYRMEKKRQDDRGALLNYICEIFDWDNPKPIVLAQVKKYYEEYGYSYIGMRSTLKYIRQYETEDFLQINPSTDGIYIVAFNDNYTRVRKEIQDRNHLAEINSKHTVSELAEPDVIVVDQTKKNEYYDHLYKIAHPEERDVPIDELLSEEEKRKYLTEEELSSLKHESREGKM